MKIPSMKLFKFFLIAALCASHASVWAQPFGSQAVESERLKDLSTYGEILRKTIEDIENERSSFLSSNASSAQSNSDAKNTMTVVEILDRHLQYFEDTLGASNVIFGAIAIAMNVDDPSKRSTVAYYIGNICFRMPGQFMGYPAGLNQINEMFRTIHSVEKKHLTQSQASLVSNGLDTAHSLRKSMGQLCARGSNPSNWAVK